MTANIKHLAAASALFWVFCSTGLVEARESAEKTAADHTITLTKVVEVYEFENLKVSVDQYQVARGDTLVKILQSRGVTGDEAQLLRLVKDLNPDLADVNMIQPGQTLNLPTELNDPPQADGGEAPLPAAEGREPATVTDTVKVYERAQPNQQSAKVVVMRHRASGGAPPVNEEPEPAPNAGSALDFPSGNHGPLAMEPGSGVVYRTVKIRKGDTLERLLRREGMDAGLIYSHLLKVTLELNPEIRNQDLIFAGTELRIPAAGDYLTPLAGVNPAAVKEAALARSRGQRPEPVERGALYLPSASAETAKNTLGLIFTRLGARLDTRGRLVLPEGSSTIEFNTREFPLVELGDRRLVIDLEARLPRQTVANLRNLPDYQVFRPNKNERFERALSKLWPLCGFYRVYDKSQAYEGGTDIKLSIAADWMIWPTETAWKSGQPLALSLAQSPERKTAPNWKAFLAKHGIEVLDLYRGAILPDDPAPAAPPLSITRLGENNPSLLAAELVKFLGAEPKVGVQLDAPATSEGAEVTAPVLWTDKSRQVVLDFGELTQDAVKTMRDEGYLVVAAAGNQPDNVIAAVLEGFGQKPASSMRLTAPAGGPVMSLNLTGYFFTLKERAIFITPLDMPEGISQLLPPGLEIVRY